MAQFVNLSATPYTSSVRCPDARPEPSPDAPQRRPRRHPRSAPFPESHTPLSTLLNDTQALAPVFEVQSHDELTASNRSSGFEPLPDGMSANRRLATGVDSLTVVRARGAHLWDRSNRRYTDYVCGLGTVLLGHANDDVNAAISVQLELGVQISATHQREIDLADQLCDALPGMDAVRLHTGSASAVQTALRVARVATSREMVLRFAGHAHGHWAAGSSLVLPWNDAAALEAAFAEHGPSLAALITEPVMSNYGGFEPAPGFFTLIRRLCNQHQTVFILDESVTGLRLGLQGAIGKYLLTGNLGPDLVICGQALGNGVPIGALAGKAKLMELLVNRAVAHGNTFSGNSIGVAAGLALLARLQIGGQGFYQRLTGRGRALMDGIEAIGRETGVSLTVRGPGPMFWLDLDTPSAALPVFDLPPSESPAYRRFRHLLLGKGVRVLRGGAWYVSDSHTDADIEATLGSVRAALSATRAAHVVVDDGVTFIPDAPAS